MTSPNAVRLDRPASALLKGLRDDSVWAETPGFAYLDASALVNRFRNPLVFPLPVWRASALGPVVKRLAHISLAEQRVGVGEIWRSCDRCLERLPRFLSEAVRRSS